MSWQTNRVSPEILERAILIVLDHEAEHPWRWAALDLLPIYHSAWMGEKIEVDNSKLAELLGREMITLARLVSTQCANGSPH